MIDLEKVNYSKWQKMYLSYCNDIVSKCEPHKAIIDKYLTYLRIKFPKATKDDLFRVFYVCDEILTGA